MWTTIGVVLVTMALTFAGLWVLLKFGMRWYFSRMLRHAQALGSAPQGVVARITMQLDKLQFSDPQVRKVIEECKALGYASAGRYTVDEMPGVKIWAGTHAQNGSLALVLELADRYFSADVIRFYGEGAALGAGTNPVFQADHYPRHVQYRQFPRDTAMQELTQWLEAQPSPSAVVAATPKNLRQLNARMYAEMMDFQLAQPMPGLEAWKRMALQDAAAVGSTVPTLTEQQWQAVYDAQRESQQSATEEALQDHVLRSGQVSAAQWQAMAHGLVYVYAHLRADEVAERALRRSAWTADVPQVQALLRQNLAHAELFEAIQRLLPEDERFAYLISVNAPLNARVYRPQAL
ncbi:hypothetical protein [Comamonas sp.]|uniref:hypothetical protein n=1 Tax=Comamonas sp. TaxID=34028 RepID=UPI00289FB7DA|nr:hypothetical protein [Comamonas sp.]